MTTNGKYGKLICIEAFHAQWFGGNIMRIYAKLNADIYLTTGKLVTGIAYRI